MSARHLYVLTAALTGVGLALFLYKVWALAFPLVPGKQIQLWNVEARLTLVADNKPVKVTLHIPRSSPSLIIDDENFVSQEFGLTLKKEQGNRQAVWSKRKVNGRRSLYYRAVVRKADSPVELQPVDPPPVQPPSLEGPSLEAARTLVSQIQGQSADVETLVAELLRLLNDPQPERNIAFLLGQTPTVVTKMDMAQKILSLAEIPARIVHGIRLGQNQRSVPMAHWLEVYEKGRWRSIDPGSGQADLSSEYLAWWRGSDPLIQATGTKSQRVTLSVTLNQEQAIRGALTLSKLKNPRLLEFSLFSLPLETQAVYRVLLMVPLGALLLVVLRNLVGIKTFGTFMPILIALAFRETQLLWGLILFSLVVAMGLGIRFYLEHLKLLLVPRLAAVLVVVVLLMAGLSVFSHRLGLERGLSVALFPMVILTMTIERMCVVWEERGALESIQQGLGSMLVASLTYSVMSLPLVEHLLFVFPELLLVLLAGILLLGRYSGFRLLELYRFKALAKGVS